MLEEEAKKNMQQEGEGQQEAAQIDPNVELMKQGVALLDLPAASSSPIIIDEPKVSEIIEKEDEPRESEHIDESVIDISSEVRERPQEPECPPELEEVSM